MAERKELVDVVDRTLRALERNRVDAVFVRNRQEALQSAWIVFPMVPWLGREIL